MLRCDANKLDNVMMITHPAQGFSLQPGGCGVRFQDANSSSQACGSIRPSDSNSRGQIVSRQAQAYPQLCPSYAFGVRFGVYCLYLSLSCP